MRQDFVTAFVKTLRGKIANKAIPIQCVFELTYRCNLKCQHCYIVNGRNKKKLETKEIFKILEQLKDVGCLYLTLSGGEPLVRKDFFEIADYARKLNFALRIFTNGTLIDKDVTDKIKNIKPISIEISLYGFKDTHEKITKVEGSFDRTIQAIELLKKRGIKVFVKVTLMKQNVGEIWKLKDYVKNDLKIKWRGIGGGLLLSPCDDGNRRPLRYKIGDRQFTEYIKKEFKEIQKENKKYKLMNINGNEHLCGAGLGICNITPYGEVNPCVQIRLKNNSLKDRSFMDIWKNHKELNRIRNLRMYDKKDCIDCEYLPYCFVCSGVALLEEGSLTAKLPEACRQAKIRKKVYEEMHKMTF